MLLLTDEGGLEESLSGPEPLVSDGDDLSVGELVALLEGAGAAREGQAGEGLGGVQEDG